MKIVSVVGARPNLIKIAPLMAEMARYPDIKPVLVHTGQHYDDNMSRTFFRELGIPQPDHNLEVGSGTNTWQTAQVMLKLEPLLQELSPDLVLVVGDVNSTLAAALVAARRGTPLAHIEAGLRSFDRTMPEEVNRVLTDAVSDHLFTTERGAADNLQREGIPGEKVHFVGNVMIDTLLSHKERALSLGMAERCGVAPGDYALVTLHRPSNVDVPEVLSNIIGVLEKVQERLPVLFPVHPRTAKMLSAKELQGRIKSLPNLRLLDPLGYLEFLGLMAQAKLVLTDSGGIQEETTILGVPCLSLRDNTERPVTVSEGTNQLVGTSPNNILTAVDRIWKGTVKKGKCPELWDGHAAERTIRILRSRN